MKNRTDGFLSDENIHHDSEIFDYIVELHDYLWRFMRVHYPGIGGSLTKLIDPIIEKAEVKKKKWWRFFKK